MLSNLHNSPHFDYSIGCYSPSYAGFTSPYMHELPGFPQSQELRTEQNDDTLGGVTKEDDVDLFQIGPFPVDESLGMTSQVSQVSASMQNAPSQRSYEYTDGSSCLHSGQESALRSSKYLSALSMENDTDPAVDIRHDNTSGHAADQHQYDYNSNQRSRLPVSVERHLKPGQGQQFPPPLPPPALSDLIQDPGKELACSSILEQTPVYSTTDKENAVATNSATDVSPTKMSYHDQYMPQQSAQWSDMGYTIVESGISGQNSMGGQDSATYQILAQRHRSQLLSTSNFTHKQQYELYPHNSRTSGKIVCSNPAYNKHAILAEKIYPYEEQSSLHRQMNYQSFLRSYQYFYGLDDEMMNIQQEGMAHFDSVSATPQTAMERTTSSSTLYKGLFCANKECCMLLIDHITRSPYCSKQCQVREQNMRQARVKPRETLIRRKHSLFRFLRTLPEASFERMQIITLVREFLRSESNQRMRSSN